MTFTCCAKDIEKTTKVTLCGLCAAVVLIGMILIATFTATLLPKNNAIHPENNETKTITRRTTTIRTTTIRTTILTSASIQQSIPTTVKRSTVTARISTARPQTSPYWISDSHFSQPRVYYDAVLFPSGSVMVCGGYRNPTSREPSCEVYTSSNTWRNAPQMNIQRSAYTLTLFANKTKVLAAGDDLAEYAQTAEVYDVVSDRWTNTLMTMTAPRYGHSAILLRNEQILIMGGFNRSGGPLSSAELFIPSSNSFITTNSMNVARALFTTTLLGDGLTVLVTGGYSTNSAATASAELYTSGSWTSTNNNMIVPRSRHAAVLLQDGNVLIAGGYNCTCRSYASAEIYNAATHTFTRVGSMIHPRAQFTLTLLPSGKVSATGGIDWATSTLPTTCELYDPVTQTWSDTRMLRTGRRLHISVLLNTSVFTMGGIDDDYNVFGSCEKYYF